MNKKVIIGAIISIVLIFTISIAIRTIYSPTGLVTAEQTPVVKVGYVPVVANLPLFVALENKYFERYNIKVEAVQAQSPNHIVESIISGNLDGAGVLAYPVVFAAEAKYPGELKLFSSADETKENYVSSIIVKKNSDIKKPKDLKGKRIGVYTGLTQVLFLKGIIKGMGMDPDKDIEIVEIAPNLQLQGLEAGQYDALSTVEPYNTIGINDGIARTLVENPRVKYIQNPFPSASGVLSANFVKEHANEAKAYIKAYRDAIDFINQNPEQAKSYILKYTPVREDLAKKVRFQKYRQIGEEDIAIIQKNADWLFKNKLIEKNIEVNPLFIDAAFIDEAQ